MNGPASDHAGAPRSRPALPGAAALVLTGGILALGTYGLSFQLGLSSRLPSEADWRAAARTLEQRASAGDAVLLAPWWAERARLELPAGLRVLALPDLAGEELVGVERVWLLALPEVPRRRDDLARALAARADPLGPAERQGALALGLHQLRHPVVPLASLAERLAGAAVALAGRPCLPDGRRGFRCPGSRASATYELREVNYRPRECLYVFPSERAAGPLTITFPAVPLGRVLRGHRGVVGEAALSGEAPVRVAISVDGRPAGAFEEPPATPGWHAFELDTSALAGRTADVTFAIAADRGEDRHLCLEAYTLR